MRRQIPQRLFSISLLLINSLPFSTVANAQAPTGIRINIVEGEGAINNIRQRVNREPVVQVEDDNHKPLAGAVVVFFLPNDGPSGTFVNGSKTLTVTTDNQGQAAARGIRFNNMTGDMQIRVTASFQGLTASASMMQTNSFGAGGGSASAPAKAGMSTGTKVLITVLIIGAAAGIGAAVYVRTHNDNTPPPPPAIVITPGTPSVGGPR